MEKEEYEYGNPIPEKYRNRLYEWKGGGYDGCFWEMNQGFVDGEGHWHPLFSTGYDGIDQDEWYERKVKALKFDFGYKGIESAYHQHMNLLHEAVEKVFGDKWYRIKGEPENDARVRKLMEAEDANYKEYVRQFEGYGTERTHRLDQMFMSVVDRTMPREAFTEIGLLDDANIKEACRLVCVKYKDNVGMMTNILDKLSGFGYSTWCTCSDCGEQFQPVNYESFGQMVDANAYHGDGGIGCIMTRVLCEECLEVTECKACYEHDLPNSNVDEICENDWKNYDFLACVLKEWIEVCWGCASGYECDHLFKWIDEDRQRVRTSLGQKYERMEKALIEHYGSKGHELYEELAKTVVGRRRINEIRDLLEDTVRETFEGKLGHDEDFPMRLDTDLPGQMILEMEK